MLLGMIFAALFMWQGGRVADSLGSRLIEKINVGQRVIVDAPNEAIEADTPWLANAAQYDLDEISPKTHRLVCLRATRTWSDGTIDEINVETIRANSWIDENQLTTGELAPSPVNLDDLGLDPDLQFLVVSIEPCPPIEEGRGRLVLTTINLSSRDP